jgi:flagella basal body P-ring formation protein FlgA
MQPLLHPDGRRLSGCTRWFALALQFGAAYSHAAGETRTQCLELTHDIPRGEAISTDRVRAITCPKDQPVQRTHYDQAAQLARAPRDLGRGEILAWIAPQRLARIRRGEQAETVMRSGAVTVTRTGVALTDTASGRAPYLATGNHASVTAPAGLTPSR